MDVPDCLEEIGRMLRHEREIRQLTLSAVAARARISQAQLSRMERGLRDSSLSTIDRVLEVFDLQLSPVFDPRWAKVDAAIAGARDRTPADRLREWNDQGLGASEITTVLIEQQVPFLVDGLSAAALQGAPVPADVFEVAVRQEDDILDRLTYALSKLQGRRWNEKWGEWGVGVSRDPREDGWTPRLYLSTWGKIKIRLVTDTTPALWVELDGLRLPVVPLTDIETTDRWARRVLQRMRNPPQN
jgi:transcriptional regulator with XRE-family HTH domain